MNNQLEKECKHRTWTHKKHFLPTIYRVDTTFENIQGTKAQLFILNGIFEIKTYGSSGIVRNLRV